MVTTVLHSHHSALVLAYTGALVGWLAIQRAVPVLWPVRESSRWKRPWREVGWAVVAVVGSIPSARSMVPDGSCFGEDRSV